ncbi:MAG TPA: glycosyl hydrolase, partial [Bacteroidales bacterium]|nr:glycosyl hydrolase [Bacteroidales bacterium]
RSNTHRVKDAERLSVRQSASVAHTNGKRFVAAEGPTSIGPQWERSPKDLKANLDRIFCSGVNRIVWHTFTSSPKEFGKPGNEYFAGTHLNPNVTWWEQTGDFISYLNRSSFMLQQGLFVADVLCYYGDDVPNFVFLKGEFPELNAGYDWDKCSRKVILDRLSFDGNKIVLPDGMSYRLLMLPDEKAINLKVLKKIEKLVQEGMTLVGPKPIRASGLSAYPESDHEVQEIAQRLWGNIDGKNITEHVYGKGRVIWGKSINQVLADMKISPDFTFTGSDKQAGLNYIHRTTDEKEIYFIVNKYNRKGINDFEYRYLTSLPDRYDQVECSFRVSGKVPELWDPLTGKISNIVTWREENGRIIIPLHFAPEGSKFVVFKSADPGQHITDIRKDGKQVFPDNRFRSENYPLINFEDFGNGSSAEIYESGNYTLKWSDGHSTIIEKNKPVSSEIIGGPWIIRFDTEWGGPQQIQIDSLRSWTDFQEDGIKYYSGKAVYVNSFKLKKSALKNKRILLDLGNVQEMAVITINGHSLSLSWKAPFQTDITPYVHKGVNELNVTVINLWTNRLIGDSKLPEEKRFTKTNVRKFDSPDSEKYLRVSGLLGPVKIVEIPVVEMRLHP